MKKSTKFYLKNQNFLFFKSQIKNLNIYSNIKELFPLCNLVPGWEKSIVYLASYRKKCIFAMHDNIDPGLNWAERWVTANGS